MTLNQHKIDLKRVNLQGFNLRGLNFEKVSFRHAKLQVTSLEKVRLPKSSLTCVKPNGARLIYSQIEGANFTQVKLRGIYLWKSIFGSSTVLKEVDFSGYGFRKIDLPTTSVEVAYLKSVFLMPVSYSQRVIRITISLFSLPSGISRSFQLLILIINGAPSKRRPALIPTPQINTH